MPHLHWPSRCEKTKGGLHAPIYIFSKRCPVNTVAASLARQRDIILFTATTTVAVILRYKV